MRPLYLAFTVHDLAAARAFYGVLLCCPEAPATALALPPTAPQGVRGMAIHGGPCRLKIAQTEKLRSVQVNLTSPSLKHRQRRAP